MVGANYGLDQYEIASALAPGKKRAASSDYSCKSRSRSGKFEEKNRKNVRNIKENFN